MLAWKLLWPGPPFIIGPWELSSWYSLKLRMHFLLRHFLQVDDPPGSVSVRIKIPQD